MLDNNSLNNQNNQLPPVIQRYIVYKLINQDRVNNKYYSFNNSRLIELSLVSKYWFKTINNLSKSLDLITSKFKQVFNHFVNNKYQEIDNYLVECLYNYYSIFNFGNVKTLMVSLNSGYYHKVGAIYFIKHFKRFQKLENIIISHTFCPVNNVELESHGDTSRLYNTISFIEENLKNIKVDVNIFDRYEFPDMEDLPSTYWLTKKNHLSLNGFNCIKSVSYTINKSLANKPYLYLVLVHIINNFKVNTIKLENGSIIESNAAYIQLIQNRYFQKLTLDSAIHISDLSYSCGGDGNIFIGEEFQNGNNSGNFIRLGFRRSLNHLEYLDIKIDNHQENQMIKNSVQHKEWSNVCRFLKNNTSMKTLIIRDSLYNQNQKEIYGMDMYKIGVENDTTIELVSRILEFTSIFQNNHNLKHIALSGFHNNILIVESLKEILNSNNSIETITLLTKELNDQNSSTAPSENSNSNGTLANDNNNNQHSITNLSNEIILVLKKITINKSNIKQINIKNKSFTSNQIKQLQYLCDERNIDLNLLRHNYDFNCN